MAKTLTKEEIVEVVKGSHECVLVQFDVFDDAMSLYQANKDDLDVLADEELEDALLEEKNVFKVEDKWVYASEWHDAEWDD